MCFWHRISIMFLLPFSSTKNSKVQSISCISNCPEIHCLKKLGTASTNYFYISLKKWYYAAATNYLGLFHQIQTFLLLSCHPIITKENLQMFFIIWDLFLMQKKCGKRLLSFFSIIQECLNWLFHLYFQVREN